MYYDLLKKKKIKAFGFLSFLLFFDLVEIFSHCHIRFSETQPHRYPTHCTELMSCNLSLLLGVGGSFQLHFS